VGRKVTGFELSAATTKHTHTHTHKHTYNLADTMASNNTTAADKITGEDIDWSAVVLLSNCDRCGVQYDAIEAAHESLCSVCQELFGDEQPPVVTTAADTTPVARDSRLIMGEVACGRCRRLFRPTNKNNGVDCTACCNRAAGKGENVFEKYSQEMTPKAKERFDEYKQRHSAPAITPAETLPSSSSTRQALQPQPELESAAPVDQPKGTTQKMQTVTPTTAPTVSAQSAAIAAKSSKRAAETSEDEDFTQQNEPTTKRSKTAQNEETTQESEDTTQRS
jgi:hypothetical protein